MPEAGRSTVATILIVGYGIACFAAFLEPKQVSAFGVFACATVLTLPYLAANIVVRLFIGALVTAVLGGIVAIFPPLAFILALWGLYALVRKFGRFCNRLPFLATGAAVYSYLWWGPHWVRTGMAASAIGHYTQYFWGAGVGLVGVLIILLFMGLFSIFSIAPTITAMLSFGYGWYLVLFVLTFLIPDGDDGDEDEIEWE